MMDEETLRSLCKAFRDRLEGCSSKNHHGHQFFPNETIKQVFEINRNDLKQLLQGLSGIPQADIAVETTLKRFTKVLATLLWMRAGRNVLEQYGRLLFPERAPYVAPCASDDHLPWDHKTALRVFPLRGEDFYEEQFQFCPVILHKKEVVIYNNDKNRCPLPYLEETDIGQGSFGSVYRVKIERHHLISEGGQNANIQRRELARKDFKMHREQAFIDEQKILRQLMDRPMRNDSITVAVASLQYGNTYSLFFPLASCNLWEYLSGSDKLSIREPSNMLQKRDIYCRGITLAGALAFLHDEFQNKETLQSLTCYHLDLKPHNILVFGLNTPLERWSITDFGLSRVKGRRNEEDTRVNWRLNMPFLKWMEVPKPFDGASTANRRAEGTYLAPEGSLGRVSWESDVWSFGCIFSLVMSFIDSGPRSVRDFSNKRREKDATSDCFYINIKNNASQVSPAVVDWFKTLKSRSRNRGNPAEHTIFCETLDYLQSKALNPARSKRPRAKDVESKLRAISQHFTLQPAAPTTSTLSRPFWSWSKKKHQPYY